ncbi:MAG TPA: hypothetical protein VFK02_13145 [Kofleriaceae bacterium]|nr:hypothetical protein [Kofleriaceae bacterium]
MATSVEKLPAITPAPPAHDTSGAGILRLISGLGALGAAAMTIGLITAIVFAAVLYLIAMFGAFMLEDGKELA